MSTTSDHQLSQVGLDRSPDQWVLLEGGDCADDLAHPCACILRVVREKMLQNAIEVVRYLRREFDPSHAIASDGAV